MGRVELDTDIEMLSVVNEKDEEISFSCDKDELHEKKLYHRGVHVFLERPRTKERPAGFVIQHKRPESENGGTWSSAASGHVRYRESYEEAAIREVYEELDIIMDPDELQEITTVWASPDTGYEFVKLYSYLMGPKDEIIPNPDELDGVAIYQLKDIEEAIDEDRESFSPVFVILLNMFLTLNKSKE